MLSDALAVDSDCVLLNRGSTIEISPWTTVRTVAEDSIDSAPE